jgi:hypothetical protein
MTGIDGFDALPGNVRGGNNSGYALLHYAIQTREPVIALLGFDMQADGQGSNYHDRNPRVITDFSYQSKMLPYFSALVNPAISRLCTIYNCNPTSKIECFSKVGFSELL